MCFRLRIPTSSSNIPILTRLSREFPHLYRDATEKVLILHKTAQDKVYLYVLRYYILYVKTVFQWRPTGGGMNQPLYFPFWENNSGMT